MTFRRRKQGLVPITVLLFAFILIQCNNEETVVEPPVTPAIDSTIVLRNVFWLKDGRTFMGIGRRNLSDGDFFYKADTAGGYVQLVYADSLAKSFPTLSPDGMQLAYLAAVRGRLLCCAHVFVMNIDGTNARDLTPFGGNWENLQWSPDSKTLMFHGGVEDSGEVHDQIVKVDIATGDAKLFTRGRYNNRDARFSFDGKKIAYLSGRIMTDYGGKVMIANADGTNTAPIDTSKTASGYPKLSPADNTLMFFWGLGAESESGVYSINFDTVMFPTTFSEYQFVYRGDYFFRTQWSPDGHKILFLTGDRPEEINIMDSDGRNKRRITKNLDTFISSYAWSPDSKQLIFLAMDITTKVKSIYLYDLSLEKMRRINLFVK